MGLHSYIQCHGTVEKSWPCYDLLTLSSTGSARFLFHGGGVQSARSLLGLSRDLIRPFVGHHTPLYSVGVYYGASRKKIFKKSGKKVEFSQFLSDDPIFGKNLKI